MTTSSKYYHQHTEGFYLDSCSAPSGHWDTGSIDQARLVVNSVTHGPNYPDWKSRLKSGRQCTTTLDGVLHTYAQSDGHILVSLNGSGCASPAARVSEYKGDIISSPLLTPSYDSNVLTRADNNAKRSMVSQLKATFQSGTFLGELGQTIRMIRDPAKSIRKGIDDYFSKAKKLKGSINRSAPLHRALAETWLGYAYGWKPLISDVEDGLKALDRLKHDNRSRRSIYAAGSDSSFVLGSAPEQSLQNVSIVYQRGHTFRATVIYRGSVSMDPGKKLQAARRLYGFTPEEFVPTVWNLIPYSFLADYFTNIGDIVDAWSYGRGNLRWASKTVINVNEINMTHSMRHKSIGYTNSISFLVYPRATQISRTVSRAAYDGNFIPSFAWELPGIGSSKWTNVAALARVKF